MRLPLPIVLFPLTEFSPVQRKITRIKQTNENESGLNVPCSRKSWGKRGVMNLWLWGFMRKWKWKKCWNVSLSFLQTFQWDNVHACENPAHGHVFCFIYLWFLQTFLTKICFSSTYFLIKSKVLAFKISRGVKRKKMAFEDSTERCSVYLYIYNLLSDGKQHYSQIMS